MRTRAAAAAATGLMIAALAPAAIASGATTSHPACTRAGLQTGLSRGSDKVSGAHVIKPFGCSGNWAYAAVNTKRFTLTSLFHVSSGRWVTIKRTPACTNGSVPKAIRRPACETN
jgi:hypothetical protein